jgi:hypothetical protein
MPTDPNYQPEPPSNQSGDIDDGIPLTGHDLLKQLHNDLLEAVDEVISIDDIGADHFMKLLDRLTECYTDYKSHAKRLEEI